MFTNIQNTGMQNINISTDTEQDFWKAIFSVDNSEIEEDAKTIFSVFDELIRDRIGSNMEVTYGIVKSYDEYNKKAQVELVTSIDYNIELINDSQNISTTDIKKEQTIDNISIFHPLKQGDNVIIIVPQGKTNSNSFIIGVLQQSGHKSLFDYYLEQKNEIMNLKFEIVNLKKIISGLNEKINSITTTTT